MAVVVIGGLITSTMLTLIVIPVVYSLLDGLVSSGPFRWLGRKVFGNAGTTSESAPEGVAD